MSTTIAGWLNLILGCVYISYGWITLADLRKNWQQFKPERMLKHFAYAWIAMAFTCGPHHLTHGIHLLAGSSTGHDALLDVYVIAAGFPAGLAWFYLQLEGLTKLGKGDRVLRADVDRSANPTIALSVLYVLSVIGWFVLFGPAVRLGRVPLGEAANVALLIIYCSIAYFLGRTALLDHRSLGGWSLSGISLFFVFWTCAIMHILYAGLLSGGVYTTGPVTLAIDLLAIPAGLYFLWVNRELYRARLA